MNPNESPAGPSNHRSTATLILGCIFALALGARIWMAFFSKATWYNTDTYLYMDMANAILEHRPFSAAPNGYPLVIAALQSLFGPTLLSVVLIVLNVIASTLIVFLCYGIGTAVLSEHAGLLAAGLIAIWPNQLNYMRQILSETPATFLVVLGVYSVLKARHLQAGIFLAAACLIRSTLVPVVVLTIVWLFLCRRKRNEILLYVSGVALVFCFNFALLELRTVVPSNNAGSNLLIAIHSSSTEGIIFNTDSFTPAQQAKPLQTYLAFAEHSPGVFLEQRLSSLWELWGPWPEPGEQYHLRSTAARLVIGLRFFLLLGALVELCRNHRSAPHWLLAIPIVVITGVHVAYFSTPRFSYTAEPFAIVLCASLLVHFGFATLTPPGNRAAAPSINPV